tara:strand:- start:1547 stop:2707 length:1161 start_codon:yes stop_codon:yes gene_type:complete
MKLDWLRFDSSKGEVEILKTRYFWTVVLTVCLTVTVAVTGCRKAYDNPIANNSEQPDKVLFDKAINDIEKRKFELARLTLQTLINTYPDSEYIAKAKLAIADSWYREGGRHALAQAEAEYKDFITFFPTMEEAAESQMKVCEIHYEQMQKADRDNTHALRADQECRQLIMKFPDSVFIESTEQMLRDIQEVIAEGEYRVGTFYAKKGSFRAGANRLQTVTDHYPLFSQSDHALWLLGETYEKMGSDFQKNAADSYAKLVRDYPLSPYVEGAKEKLVAFDRPIPEPDAEMFEVMKYNLEHRTEKGRLGKTFGVFSGKPDLERVAKRGKPASGPLIPTVPAGIRKMTDLSSSLAADTDRNKEPGSAEPSAEVTVETVEDPSETKLGSE